MKTSSISSALILLGILAGKQPGAGQALSEAPLPSGISAVWDLSRAYREATPTRERVCLNGLWRWQPAGVAAETVPSGQWGFFKVPGSWPGITDYMQKDCQTVFAHPEWKNVKLGSVPAAWYQRTITVPDEWTGRRITLQAECVNSFAAVYVDGKKAGEIRFPDGELDLTTVCRPGATHELSLLVVALPLKGVMLSYTDSASAREVKGAVARRGLCGDVFLTDTPPKARIAEVRVNTSVRQWTISFNTALQDLAANARYSLNAVITKDGRKVAEFKSKDFAAAELQENRFPFSAQWQPAGLWDLHTPSNQYHLEMSLRDNSGKILDAAWSQRFGFREFWISGRDFYLNGTRLYLSCVPLDNAQVGAAWASYAGARESLERLKSFGINFLYTHNYNCQPGAHLSFAEILRAADDAGVLISLAQPHFSHYEWKEPEADTNNGYARHAASYVRMAQNHPSVVFYSMSHNATGYGEDMNPDMIDGKSDPRDRWALNNSKLALRAEAIVNRLDSHRIVYHHASGNLGTMHPINFYPNFVPIQEMSDWFGHWASQGVKPVFLCEYGAPFSWDWTMYRGWYKDQREFGSARVPWEFCLAEWNAQFLGDGAYRISEAEKANLRWEAKQMRAGKLWYRWDYPYEVGSTRLDERFPVFAMYLTDNWRAFRTWGVSAFSPWEHGHFWKLREGMNKTRKNLAVDWQYLQRPGFSADYIDQCYERMDLAYERSDWIATAAAQALLRNNQPLLAYLAGKPAAFTSKDHNFYAGETFEKQLLILNNSRTSVTCRCEWSLDLPQRVSNRQEASVATGQKSAIPLRFELPDNLTPGQYVLRVIASFDNGESQKDSLVINILPHPSIPKVKAKIALFDPPGETARWLQRLGIAYELVDSKADLAGYEILVVGKAALTLAGAAPFITRVQEGLRVVMFEQSAPVLEQRFGFRVAEYGLRWVFPRIPDHPLLAGLTEPNLANWRGEATLQPPKLQYETRPRYGPTVKWCDMPVPHLWRCGNRGNVASVLIEKPACGDFLPILDGGYSLQYSPLLEYREGKGLLLFCQMDVTGRTEADPAAEILGQNILRYALSWQPASSRSVVYAGEEAGKNFLAAVGIAARPYDGNSLASTDLLVVGPRGGEQLAPNAAALSAWLKTGGPLLTLGLDAPEANRFLPFKVNQQKREHISCFFEAEGRSSPFAGMGPADFHNRDPRELPLVTDGAKPLGNGILAKAETANVFFSQWVPWQFDPLKQSNLKRTFRRAAAATSRLLANLGAPSSTPIISRFSSPVNPAKPEKRWLSGLYLDQPEEWDDPYRFFRW